MKWEFRDHHSADNGLYANVRFAKRTRSDSVSKKLQGAALAQHKAEVVA